MSAGPSSTPSIRDMLSPSSVTVTPAADTAEVVALAGGLDVGSLTRLAIREHKARTGQDAVE